MLSTAVVYGDTTPTTSSSYQAPPNRLIVPPGDINIDGVDYVITNDGFYFSQGSPDFSVMRIQPFYGSVSITVFILALSVFLSWISVIALHISSRRRPWLQTACLILNAGVLTSTLARGGKCLSQQYSNGYEDPWELVNALIYGYNYTVPQLICLAVSWMAHFQIILMLFEKPRQKIVLQWIAAILWILEVIFWSIVYFRRHNAFYYQDGDGTYTDTNSQGVRAEPNEYETASVGDDASVLNWPLRRHMLIVAVVFELFLCALYFACVIWHTILQRRHAYAKKNIPIAVISILVMLAPLGFVPLFLLAPASGWAGFITSAVDGVTLVVVWNWLDAITNAEREEQQKGIMGRRIYDDLAMDFVLSKPKGKRRNEQEYEDATELSNMDFSHQRDVSSDSLDDEPPSRASVSPIGRNQPVYLDAVLNWPANTVKKKTRALKKKLHLMTLPTSGNGGEGSMAHRRRQIRASGNATSSTASSSGMARFMHPYNSHTVYQVSAAASDRDDASNISNEAMENLAGDLTQLPIAQRGTSPNDSTSDGSSDFDVVDRVDDINLLDNMAHGYEFMATNSANTGLHGLPHDDDDGDGVEQDDAPPDAYPPLAGFGPGDYWDDKSHPLGGPSG